MAYTPGTSGPGGPGGPGGPSGGSNQVSQQAQQKFAQLPKIDLSKERQKYERLADLYSTIVSTEHLEIVWARGACTDDEYTEQCTQLITRWKAQKPNAEAYYNNNIDDFFKEYCPDCHAARNRLLKIGVPATTFHGTSQNKLSDAKGLQLIIAQTVQHFITTVDGLQLSLRAVDEIHPHLKELMSSINKVTSLPPDNISKIKVQEWLIKLNQMKASQELNDDDIRQMTFDLENAYAEFVKYLQGE